MSVISPRGVIIDLDTRPALKDDKAVRPSAPTLSRLVKAAKDAAYKTE